MTSARAEKVILIWGIDILEVSHFLLTSRSWKEFFMSGFVPQTESSFVFLEFNESRAPTAYGPKALA